MASERWIKAQFLLHTDNVEGAVGGYTETRMMWEALCQRHPQQAEEFLNGLQKQFETICKNDSVEPRRT